ncbi:hypothetical protein TNCV_2120691, partial [Trichonephila clavipes]
NCGGGDRGRVAIYRPFGELAELKSYCHLYCVVLKITTGVPLAHHDGRGPRSDCVRQLEGIFINRTFATEQNFQAVCLNVNANISSDDGVTYKTPGRLINGGRESVYSDESSFTFALATTGRCTFRGATCTNKMEFSRENNAPIHAAGLVNHGLMNTG